VTTVQLAISNKSYAHALQILLADDGQHNVTVVNEPTFRLPGVIVTDAALLGDSLNSTEASRFVVIAHSGTDDLSRLWQAGFPTVVYDREPVTVVYLAILAAELRLNGKNLGTASPGLMARRKLH
jgi:hypothetical protein